MRPSSSQTGPRRSNGIRPPTRPLPSMAAPAGSPQTVGRSPSKPQIPSTPQQTPNPIIPKADSGSSEEESSSDESETHSMAQAPKATPVPVPSVSESAHPNVLTNNEEETGSESDEDSDGEDEDKGTRLTPATESLKAPVIPNGLPLVATSKVESEQESESESEETQSDDDLEASTITKPQPSMPLKKDQVAVIERSKVTEVEPKCGHHLDLTTPPSAHQEPTMSPKYADDTFKTCSLAFCPSSVFRSLQIRAAQP